jgi:hypothetical protein
VILPQVERSESRIETVVTFAEASRAGRRLGGGAAEGGQQRRILRILPHTPALSPRAG